MDSYLGEIRLFAGSFAPKDWAFCDGSLLPIQYYTALFSLLGVNYGGDGVRTFALPDLRGRAPMHWGTGNGLTPRQLGEMNGEATHQLTLSEMPAHIHLPNTVSTSNSTTPVASTWSGVGGRGSYEVYGTTVDTTLNPGAIRPAGEGQGHENRQPFQALSFIISLKGEFPPRPQ